MPLREHGNVEKNPVNSSSAITCTRGKKKRTNSMHVSYWPNSLTQTHWRDDRVCGPAREHPATDAGTCAGVIGKPACARPLCCPVRERSLRLKRNGAIKSETKEELADEREREREREREKERKKHKTRTEGDEKQPKRSALATGKKDGWMDCGA